MSLGNWDEARRLLPFAQKGILNAAQTQQYGKGEREHLKKKAWTPTDDEQPSGRGAKDQIKKKGTGATVVPEPVSLPPLPPVLQMEKPTEDRCKYVNLTSFTSSNFFLYMLVLRNALTMLTKVYLTVKQIPIQMLLFKV